MFAQCLYVENLGSSLQKHAHAIYSDFHGCKNDTFQLNFFDYFHIFAQNIYCGYTLELLNEAVPPEDREG